MISFKHESIHIYWLLQLCNDALWMMNMLPVWIILRFEPIEYVRVHDVLDLK